MIKITKKEKEGNLTINAEKASHIYAIVPFHAARPPFRSPQGFARQQQRQRGHTLLYQGDKLFHVSASSAHYSLGRRPAGQAEPSWEGKGEGGRADSTCQSEDKFAMMVKDPLIWRSGPISVGNHGIDRRVAPAHQTTQPSHCPPTPPAGFQVWDAWHSDLLAWTHTHESLLCRNLHLSLPPGYIHTAQPSGHARRKQKL